MKAMAMADAMAPSQSFASLRRRPSHAKARSTTLRHEPEVHLQHLRERHERALGGATERTMGAIGHGATSLRLRAMSQSLQKVPPHQKRIRFCIQERGYAMLQANA